MNMLEQHRYFMREVVPAACAMPITDRERKSLKPIVEYFMGGTPIADVAEQMFLLLLNKVDTLTVENHRLRETLEKIRDQDYRGNPCSCSGIARRALEQK